MLRIRDIAARDGVAPDAIWARVRSGELAAYRAPWGRDQWEWRLTEHGLPDAVSSGSTLLLLPPERVA